MSTSWTAHHAPVPAFGPGLGNRDLDLVPRPSRGSGTVEYDFPGIEVGTAEYAEGPTGATVVHVPHGARTTVDARGGAIGITGRHEVLNHAICLAGGSAYGLAASAGVFDELLRRRDNRVDWENLQGVSGAVIYDFAARDNGIYPDAAVGRAALLSAEHGRVPVGRAGAGRSASVGKIDWSRCEFAGQGAAFRQVGQVKILALTVVNAVGVVVDRDGTVVRGNRDPVTGERQLPAVDYETALSCGQPAITRAGNTTVSVLVTNVRLPDRELAQLGRQVHSSMHRGIQPFHTNLDGDTLFTLTTDEITLGAQDASSVGAEAINSVAVGAVASEVMWDAILCSLA